MRSGYLGVLVGLLAGAGLASAQAGPDAKPELPAPSPAPENAGPAAPPAAPGKPTPDGAGLPAFSCPPPPVELPTEGQDGCGPTNAFDPCAPSPCCKCRIGYFEAEYLGWTIQNPLAPDRPLLTTGTAA